MNKTQYLNEERYLKTKKKLQITALIILIIGVICGGLLIYKGVSTKSIDKNALKAQQHEEFMKNGFSKKYYDLQDEIRSDDSKYTFIISGVIIIVVTGIASLSIYITAKRREITAFGLQQMMPIVQEGMNTVAPTMANTTKEIADIVAPTMGNVAKEITKGIKDGLKDDKK